MTPTVRQPGEPEPWQSRVCVHLASGAATVWVPLNLHKKAERFPSDCIKLCWDCYADWQNGQEIQQGLMDFEEMQRRMRSETVDRGPYLERERARGIEVPWNKPNAGDD